jgi:hypothetical protein
MPATNAPPESDAQALGLAIPDKLIALVDDKSGSEA